MPLLLLLLAAQQPTTLPAGLTFTVYSLEELHAGAQEPHEPVLFILAQDVVLFPGQPPVLPRKTLLAGTVVRSEQAGRFVGRAAIGVQFDHLLLPDGSTYPLSARLVSIRGQNVTGSTINGKGHATSDALLLLFPPTTLYKALRLPARGPRLRLDPEQAMTIKLLAPLTIGAARASTGRPTTATAEKPTITTSTIDKVGTSALEQATTATTTLERPTSATTTAEKRTLPTVILEKPPTSTATSENPTTGTSENRTRRGAETPQLPGLRPEHRALLARTGWLAYVLSNIDRVEYYDAPTVPKSTDGRIGEAHYLDNTRIARIATSGMSAQRIASTIVHEDAHLEGIREHGAYFDQAYAWQKEREFQRDLR